MICRTYESPIPNFPIHLAPAQLRHLRVALDVIGAQGTTAEEKLMAIHRFGYSFVSTYHPNSSKNELDCPVMKFMIAHHIVKGGTGYFLPPSRISPSFSQMQWAWRAMGLYEAYLRREEHENFMLG
jgi:hypothetical protein